MNLAITKRVFRFVVQFDVLMGHRVVSSSGWNVRHQQEGASRGSCQERLKKEIGVRLLGATFSLPGFVCFRTAVNSALQIYFAIQLTANTTLLSYHP